jgi:dTDP-4-dehydrorhamnose reductase
MQAIITGARGTVGSALCKMLDAQGHTAIPWDRSLIPIDNYAAMETFVRESRADALFHLAIASQSTGRANEGWLVNIHWTSELAWICRQLGVRFIFSSTVMVFTDAAMGPFTPESIPDAREGYGYEKLQAEERVRQQNPDAVIARLGWQIGDAPGSNNMVDFLERQMQTEGTIRASQHWYPACSLVGDTAAGLIRLASAAPGTYLLDSNRRWSFAAIVQALNAHHGNRWQVTVTDDFVYDQRMLDARVGMPGLDARLVGLISS